MADAAREVRAHLPEDILGYYDAGEHVIVLGRHLTPAELRCTAMHEQIHAEHRDAALCVPWHDRRQERAVEHEAARRLIGFDDLIDSLTWCTSLDEVAEDLNVDMDTLLNRIDCLDPEDLRAVDARIYGQGRGIA